MTSELLEKAQKMASNGYHQDALPIFGEIIRTPFVSPSISFQARLARARTFLKIAKELKSTTAQEGEYRPKIGMDTQTFCDMAQNDLEELIRTYSSEIEEESEQRYDLLERVYVTRVEASDVVGDCSAKRRFIISGLCEFPNSEKLKSFLHQNDNDETEDKEKDENENENENEKNSSSSGLLSLHSASTGIYPSDLQLECAICQNIFLEPISIACGHNFCRACLASTMDHASTTASLSFTRRGGGGGQVQKCPLCRVPLHIDVLNFPINLILQHVVQTLFPTQYRERKQEVEQANNQSSSSSSSSNTTERSLPLFVCNSSSPGHTVAFNIFEPRYRLMFRRIIRGSREFGLFEGREEQNTTGSNAEESNSSSSSSFPFYAVGTLVRVTDSIIQPDGRITITGMSVKRIKVKSSSEIDGYRIGICEDYQDDDARCVEEAVAAATACRLLTKKMVEKFSENPRLPRAPPFCTELINAPSRTTSSSRTSDEKPEDEKKDNSQQKEDDTKNENQNSSEEDPSSSTNAVDEKWAMENFHRVVVPSSLWLGEFFYPQTWQNLILTNTAQRLKLCLSQSATLHAGNSATNFLASAASFFQSSILGRVLGMNNNNSNNNSS